MTGIMQILQRNLKEKMMAKGFSAHNLERQAGLRPSAVQNILSGRSKSPGIDIVAAIAQILECPIDALIKDDPKDYNDFSSKVSQPWDGKLYSLSLDLVLKLLKEKELNASKDIALKYAEQVYNYSLAANRKAPDKSFAKWIIEKIQNFRE